MRLRAAKWPVASTMYTGWVTNRTRAPLVRGMVGFNSPKGDLAFGDVVRRRIGSDQGATGQRERGREEHEEWAKASHADSSSIRGSRIWKRAPPSGPSSTEIVPPKARTWSRTSASPRAGAAGHAPIIRRATAKESLEDRFAFFERHPRTGVVDVDGELAVGVIEPHGCRSFGVAMGVINQVGDNTLESSTVHRDHWIANGGGDFDGGLVESVATRGPSAHFGAPVRPRPRSR